MSLLSIEMFIRKNTLINIVIFAHVMMLLSCQPTYKSGDFSLTTTSDDKGFVLETKFSILVNVDEIDVIYKWRPDGSARSDGSVINDGAITGSIRTKIGIFLSNYVHTIDSVTLEKQIKDGSLNQLIKDHLNQFITGQIKDWSRLQGVKMKKVKVVIGEL